MGLSRSEHRECVSLCGQTAELPVYFRIVQDQGVRKRDKLHQFGLPADKAAYFGGCGWQQHGELPIGTVQQLRDKFVGGSSSGVRI